VTAILGGASVHPRMRERRVEVEMDRSRRRRKWLLTAALLVALGSAAGIFLQSSWVEVDHVGIVGGANTPPEAVREAAGIEPGASLLTLDLGPAREAVAKLPWVDEVTASADWYGDVLFEISERQPVAQVATPGGYSVVDSEGRVLTLSAEPYPGLMVITGVAGGGAGSWLGDAGLAAVQAAAVVGPELAPFIGSVAQDPDGSLYLELTRGGRVLMGDTREMGAKIVALRTLIDQVEMGCVGIIDVRAATAPVITRAC
jgi:hypothetical protein